MCLLSNQEVFTLLEEIDRYLYLKIFHLYSVNRPFLLEISIFSLKILIYQIKNARF